MKFSVDKSGPIEKLMIRLNSCNVNFSHEYRPIDPIEYRYPIEQPNVGVILFNDSHEIDMLIEALERFKDISQNYMGAWRAKP